MQYIIQLKDYNNKVHTIKLISVYGIKRKTYNKIWVSLCEKLWEYYFNSLVHYYAELFNLRQHFELSGVKFTNEGIEWDKEKLTFNEIAISSYRTYFMIYKAENYKLNKSISFSSDWNAHILLAILKGIVQYNKEIPACPL